MTPQPHNQLPPARAQTPESVRQGKCLWSAPAKDVPFFTPAQKTPAGTLIKPRQDGAVPRLFTPVKIRGVEMPNRIWLSPLCQYSAHEGFHTPWHDTHLGGIIQRGPGLTMVEATAVSANGRITPEDSGIWLDAHIPGLRKHVDFAHSQNALIAIQIAHAGRKASTVSPWLSSGAAALADAGGWPHDVVGPSDEPFDELYPKPRAASLEDIKQIKADFVAGVRRAVIAGFDVIELHFAHGYLVSSFMSPAVNKRTDQYGGSFENRVRLALEIAEEARAAMPEDMPLFVRISATDWLSNNPEWKGDSWDLDEATELAKQLADRGVDVIDVSSGGIHKSQKVNPGIGYQVPFARHIKEAVGDKALISAVGSIKTGEQAEEAIAGGKDGSETKLDLIAAGRMFQKNPGLVWAWADDLEVTVQTANQIGWGFGGRAAVKAKPETTKINGP